MDQFLEPEQALKYQTMLTRAQRKQLRRQQKKENKISRQSNLSQNGVKKQSNMTLKDVYPMTEAQEDVFEAFSEQSNLLLHGLAGTGKSFIFLYLALREILETGSYKKLKIIRSAVSARDIGFLPGTVKEKTAVFESPYISIVNDLFGRGDAYDILTQRGIIEFEVTSHLRGETFSDTIVFVDEFQNLNYQELCTVITRVGKNCRIAFAGDYSQSDLQWMREKQGALKFMKILNNMISFETIEFGVDDIVRSGIVKEFLIEKLNYEKENARDEFSTASGRDQKVYD